MVREKTMTGLLSSQGLCAGQRSVGKSFQRANPGYHHADRTGMARKPIPYHTDYLGHKLHVDQNQKHIMFGVTHMCAVDGYSENWWGLLPCPSRTVLRFIHILSGKSFLL